MMEFLAANFNLRLQRLSLSIEMIRKGRGLEHSARALFSETKS